MPNQSNKTLSYAVGHSSFCHMLAIWSAKGLYRLELGASAHELEIQMQQKFSGSDFHSADNKQLREFHSLLKAIDIPPNTMPDVTLDLQGTPFQQRVWQAIRTIQPGQTLSYTTLAGKLGNPKASRAVANACGANPLAFVIPCHRVIRSDGSLGGYRWGLAMKKALLRRENTQLTP